MGSVFRVAAFAALTAFGGCSQAPAPPAAKLWTLFDVQTLYAHGATADHPLAANAGLPGGIPIGRVLNGTELFLRPSLAEQYAASYVTTEVWSGYDQVWMQPMYVPVTGWSGGAPQILKDASGAWHPVFSVEPGSGFYSPFWQAVYFDAPSGTATDTFTSAQQILDAGLPLHPREGWTIPIVPDDVTVAVSGPIPGHGWFDGAKVSFLNFGTQLFTWDAVTNVVAETPLFVFVMRDANGNLQAPNIPTVGGTGPVGSGGPDARLAGEQPIYASYWRIYTVELPATAAVFADANLQLELQGQGLTAVTVDPTVASDESGAVGLVAINPVCFGADNTADPDLTNVESGHCIYLDSQARIEDNLDPGTIQPTNITVTCPFVTEKGAVPVSPIR